MKTIHSSTRLAGPDFIHASSIRPASSLRWKSLGGSYHGGGGLWLGLGLVVLALVLAIDAGARPYRSHGHSYGYGYGHRGYGGLGLSGGYRVYRGYVGHGYHGYGGYYSYGSYGHGTFASYYPSYVPRTYFWSRGGSGTGIQVYSSGQGSTSLSIVRPPVYVMEPMKSVAHQRFEAWGHLAEGNDDAAALTFEAMEQQLPGTAWPKIGTGLLAGFSGDYWAAKYRFRRAFRFDASGPGELPQAPALNRRMTELANHYRGVMARGGAHTDAEFMVAALTFLARDYSSAQLAIETAMLHGDVSRSAVNLKRLIDRAMIVAGESRVDPEVASAAP